MALVASALVPASLAQSVASKDSKQDQVAAQARMQKASESFVENAGQWNNKAKFLSKTQNMNFWVTNNSIILDYYRMTEAKSALRRDGHVVEMQFEHASSSAKAEGVKKARLISQYLGPKADFKKAKVAHSFAESKISSLYPGVDLRAYVENDTPRYDLIVAPNADTSNIRVRFAGVKDVSIDANGNLTMKTKVGRVDHQDLVAYQWVNGQKKVVEAKFKKLGRNTIGYALGAYDHSQKLIIDPIIYGSYYGGDQGIDEVRSVVADNDGGVFMTGSTDAPDFPITAGPYGVSISGSTDAFITKFQGDAYSHDYAAYFGGSGNDTGKFIGLDPSGVNIWIAGTTSSSDFPGVGVGSYQQTKVGATDIFLIKFSKDPTDVLVPGYSTYFGSSSAAGGEELKGFAIGKTSGRIFLAGTATASGLPNANNAYPGSAQAGYLTEMNNTATAVDFSTYVGGTAPIILGIGTTYLLNNQTGPTSNTTSKETGNALAIDVDDNAVVTGTVVFQGNENTATAPTPSFPTTAAVFPGGRLLRNMDAFAVKIAPNGSVVFSTLLGGADNDTGCSVATDPLGSIYLVGYAG
jgi:hypothetical protein